MRVATRVFGAVLGLLVGGVVAYLVGSLADGTTETVLTLIAWPIVFAATYTAVVDGPRSLRGLIRR